LEAVHHRLAEVRLRPAWTRGQARQVRVGTQAVLHEAVRLLEEAKRLPPPDTARS
jgi:hypothetical protein